MPRPRKAQSSKPRAQSRGAQKSATADSAGNVLKCPECGKEFTRAASLGAHRNRAHGVAGGSSRRVASTRRASGNRNGRPRSPRATPTAGGRIDRDALLQALFPQGIPAKEQVIRDVNAWLDQAERLARQA